MMVSSQVTRVKTCRFTLFTPLLLVAAFSANAFQEHHHADGQSSERLGTVSFTISCSPRIQSEFARGVALLHSFGYEAAEKVFQQIETEEPSCAMAYWGHAMTHYHQLWDRPSPADLAKGWALVKKAEAAGPKTKREQEYIETVAAFYRNGPKESFESRSDAYIQALEKLHQHFPDDHEAAIFYALSLVGSPHANDNDFADRKKAVSILNAVLKDEPDHPGVAHYLIHACDNPEMAQEGLPAARRYAQIAPGSAHALHMPSHIFARLGLWQDDIASNLESKAAAEKQGSTGNRAHAMDFLEYAYLQTGQSKKAKSIEEEGLSIPRKDFPEEIPGLFSYVQVHFPALFVLETRAWKDGEALKPPPDAAPDFQATIYWAQAIAAGHLHDIAAARAAVENYDRALDAVKKSAYAYVADEMTTTRDEAHAWLAFAEGNAAEGTRRLGKVADEQDKVGKGEVELPAREMLADMLLELHRPADAMTEYERSFKTDPNRFDALYGAARAAEAAGKPESAALYYKQLLANCPEGDRPELARDRSYLKGGYDAGDSDH